MTLPWGGTKTHKYNHTSHTCARVIWSSGGLGFGGTERQLGSIKSHWLLAARQVTGKVSPEMILLWPWKQPIRCPFPVRLAGSRSSLPPSLHFLPGIPQDDGELPLCLPSFGPGRWKREPLYWPQRSPKGYIGIPTPRWPASANRFGMSARLHEPHIRGYFVSPKAWCSRNAFHIVPKAIWTTLEIIQLFRMIHFIS